MKKLMFGVIAAGFGAFVAVTGAQAQSGAGQTGMGDAMKKDMPSSAGATSTGMSGAGMGKGMAMKRHHRHRRHHRKM